jgi:hypothetical protein
VIHAGEEKRYRISGNSSLLDDQEVRYSQSIRETDSLGWSFLPGRRRKAAVWEFDPTLQVVRSLATIEASIIRSA